LDTSDGAVVLVAGAVRDFVGVVAAENAAAQPGFGSVVVAETVAAAISLRHYFVSLPHAV